MYHPYLYPMPLKALGRPVQNALSQNTFRVRAGLLDQFRAQAEFRAPHELGGLLRVEHDSIGPIATEYKLFEQVVDPGNFELNGEAIAKWQMQLMINDREDQLAQWSGIIHSHPRMKPYMSHNDYNNLQATAGQREAWSLICTVGKPYTLPGRDYQQPMELCHYYNGKDDCADPNMAIISEGVATALSAERLAQMKQEVDDLTTVRFNSPLITAYHKDWFRK